MNECPHGAFIFETSLSISGTTATKLSFGLLSVNSFGLLYCFSNQGPWTEQLHQHHLGCVSCADYQTHPLMLYPNLQFVGSKNPR